MDSSLYDKVYAYAEKKHTGQFRKDGVEQYINHPRRVSLVVREFGGSIEQQCAGLLHDVVEDTGTSQEQLVKDLQQMTDDESSVEKIAKYVDDLTCKYTKEAYPNLNRQKRKKLELAEFQNMADSASKIVKLADIIDNLSSVEKLEEDFAEQYLCEDFKIIRAIRVDNPIYDKAVEVFLGAMRKLL